MKHSIIIDTSLKGREYGPLRSFENMIISITGAKIIRISKISKIVEKRMGHTMPGGRFRKILIKQKIDIETDVLWCVLMSPENFKLDLFRNWSSKPKIRILYLFDTLQHQFPLIKKLFSDNKFNLKITSFSDAIPYLEGITKNKWHCIEQAAPDSLFKPVPYNERIIAFSSYGRRDERFHKLLIKFCKKTNLYYDFTTENKCNQLVDNIELYKQYAWHINHSIFNISWPVEITNEKRAGILNPITCRWFEVALAGTLIIGSIPNNKSFKNYFDKDFIQSIDLNRSDEQIFNDIEDIWNKREKLYNMNSAVHEKRYRDWSWESRVSEMLELIQQDNSEFDLT